MSYVQETLGPGETIVWRTTYHWFIFRWAALAVVVGLAIAVYGDTSGTVTAILLAPGVLLCLQQFLNLLTTEFAVTTRRVVVKAGIVERRTNEMQLALVESIRIQQSIAGRALDYGTLVIGTAGASFEPVPFVKAPLEFRRQVQQQIEKVSPRFGPATVFDPAPRPATAAREERDCPFCGESILRKAIRCRYCGQDVPSTIGTIAADEDATHGMSSSGRPSNFDPTPQSAAHGLPSDLKKLLRGIVNVAAAFILCFVIYLLYAGYISGRTVATYILMAIVLGIINVWDAYRSRGSSKK
jgi:hypothetical protein